MTPRDKRKLAKSRQREKRRRGPKDRLEAVLGALGLLRLYRDLPAADRNTILATVPPPVSLDPESAARVDPRVSAIARAVLIEPHGRSDGLSWGSYGELLSTYPAVYFACDALARGSGDRAYRDGLAAAAGRVDDLLDDRWGTAWGHLNHDLTLNLLRDWRPDAQVGGVIIDKAPAYRVGGPFFRVAFEAADPEVIEVAIDEAVRPVYRCMFSLGTIGVLRVGWDGLQVGLPGGAEHPVYIQSHAFRRLLERVPFGLEARCGLFDSLSAPNVTWRGDGSGLIEYRLFGHRLGYLTCQMVGGAVVLTTFLFLTMEGTPEGWRLRRRLGLVRPDVEYLSLDRMDPFLSPGVREDPVLVRLLRECGCGPVLDLAVTSLLDAQEGDYAGELRRYLEPMLDATRFADRRSASAVWSPKARPDN